MFPGAWVCSNRRGVVPGKTGHVWVEGDICKLVTACFLVVSMICRHLSYSLTLKLLDA